MEQVAPWLRETVFKEAKEVTPEWRRLFFMNIYN